MERLGQCRTLLPFVMNTSTANIAACTHSGGTGEGLSSPFKSSPGPPPSTIGVTAAVAPNPSRLISTVVTNDGDSETSIYSKRNDQTMNLQTLATSKMTSLARTCLRTAIIVATNLHSHGATPIHVAVIRGMSDEWLGRLLWAHRLAASVQDRSSSLTPLHVALRYRHTSLKAVQLLARAQPVCLSISSRKGHLPIHVAAQYSSSVEIVSYLLTSLPESVRSITGDDGDTPLHLAARADNDRGDEIVLTLVDWAPDLSMKRNRIGETPFSIVCGLWDAFVSSPVGGDRVRGIVLGGDTGSIMQSSGLLKRLWNKMSHLAKARYCTISNRAVSQNTLISDRFLLHAAVGSSCPSSFVKLVLQLHPSQMDQIDRTGRFPLAIAAETNFRSKVEGLSIISCILSAYPECAAMRDNSGDYPLHMALRSKKTWDFGIRRIFEAFPPAIEKVDAASGLPSFIFAAAGEDSVPNKTAVHDSSDVKSENFDAGSRRFSLRRGKIIPRNDSFDEFMRGASLHRLFSTITSLKSWESDLESDGAESASGSDPEAEAEEGRDPTGSRRQATRICSEPRDDHADQIDTIYRLVRGSPSVLRTKLTSGSQSK